MSSQADSKTFHEDMVKKYPRSNRRLTVRVGRFGLEFTDDSKESGTSVHISPYGIEFRSTEPYIEGTLLKIHVTIPDYWSRKQQFVEYGRVDTPGTFKMLAKVVSTEDIGKRRKKKMILARTVNMDEVDEEVLKNFLQEA